MIIVLEGPRGVGKTTIAHNLVPVLTNLGFKPTIAKFTRGEDPTADMQFTIRKLVADSHGPGSPATIIDRFHLTEFVMRTADDSVPRSKLALDMVSLSYQLEHAGAWVFVLNADESVREERVKQRDDGRGDEPVDVIDTWRFLTTFLIGPSSHRLFSNVFFVDTFKVSPSVVVAEMMGMIRGRLSSHYVHLG